MSTSTLLGGRVAAAACAPTMPDPAPRARLSPESSRPWPVVPSHAPARRSCPVNPWRGRLVFRSRLDGNPRARRRPTPQASGLSAPCAANRAARRPDRRWDGHLPHPDGATAAWARAEDGWSSRGCARSGCDPAAGSDSTAHAHRRRSAAADQDDGLSEQFRPAPRRRLQRLRPVRGAAGGAAHPIAVRDGQPRQRQRLTKFGPDLVFNRPRWLEPGRPAVEIQEQPGPSPCEWRSLTTFPADDDRHEERASRGGIGRSPDYRPDLARFVARSSSARPPTSRWRHRDRARAGDDGRAALRVWSAQPSHGSARKETPTRATPASADRRDKQPKRVVRPKIARQAETEERQSFDQPGRRQGAASHRGLAPMVPDDSRVVMPRPRAARAHWHAPAPSCVVLSQRDRSRFLSKSQLS